MYLISFMRFYSLIFTPSSNHYMWRTLQQIYPIRGYSPASLKPNSRVKASFFRSVRMCLCSSALTRPERHIIQTESGGHPTVCEPLRRAVCNPGRCVNTAGRPPMYNLRLLYSFWSLLHWLLNLQGHLGNAPVHAWRKDFDLIYRAVFHHVATAALNIHDLWDGLASERACYFHWWFMRVFSRQAHMYINIK